jgi:hypothetical protein
MLHRREVDVARRLAASATDLQPGKPPFTAWSMVGDGSIGSPSDQMRSFQLSQISFSGLLDQRFALCPHPGGLRGQDVGRRTRLAELSSLFRALRSPPDRGVGRYFGAIRTSREIGSASPGELCLEIRPTPVVLMAASPLLTGIVQEPLCDIVPDPVAAIQSDCIGGLNFHGPLAPLAGDAQHVALNF